MGERTRAAFTVLSVVAVVGAVFLLARSTEHGRDARSTASAKAPKCRMVCRCSSEEQCGIMDCSDDCHPADPSLCVDTMICPKGYVWSKTDCSCNAVR